MIWTCSHPFWLSVFVLTSTFSGLHQVHNLSIFASRKMMWLKIVGTVQGKICWFSLLNWVDLPWKSASRPRLEYQWLASVFSLTFFCLLGRFLLFTHIHLPNFAMEEFIKIKSLKCCKKSKLLGQIF